MPMTEKGIERLKLDEGFRAEAYLCTAGYRTIGYGHNLDANPLNLWPPISEEQAEKILFDDLSAVEKELLKSCPPYKMLVYRGEFVRADVMLNMAFNLGVRGLGGFKRMLSAILTGDYLAAAHEMLDSKWAGQVGLRADRLSVIMRTGRYPQ